MVYMRKKKTMRRKKPTRRATRKKLGSTNGATVRAGLTSQAICYDPNTVGTINLLYETAPVPSVYTGGPLSIGVGTTITGVQSFFTANGVAGYGYDFGASFTHMAADLQRWNDIRMRYDQYRIRKVRIKIESLYNVGTGGLGEMTCLPTAYYAIDKDDAGIPASQASLTGRADCKQFQFSTGKPLVITYKPCARLQMMSTSTTGYSLKTSPWIDTVNNAFVPHFGLKMWLTDVCCPGTYENGSLFRVTTQYWIDFRGTQNIY